jgi:xanthine dehydrogenase accessory factor
VKELLGTLGGWQAEGVAVGRAVLVRTFGSSPWREGATLLRTADGRIAGAVSGGCVEAAAAEAIERAMRTGREQVIRYGISDRQAWDVGLACGGTIDVLVQPDVPSSVVAAASAGREQGGVAVASWLPEDAPPPEPGAHPTGAGALPAARTTVAGAAAAGEPGRPAADPVIEGVARAALTSGQSRTVVLGGRQAWVEVFPVPPRLVIVGAVQIALSLVTFARELGWETVVVDGRPAFATRDRFPDVDQLVVGWPDEAADSVGLGPADAVAVLTHDPKFDEPAIVEALRRGCRYVGAIGSRRTQADRRARLAAAGVPDEHLQQLRGPIGLDLGGRAPAETAVAIVAEILAAGYGGTGRPMRDVSRERAAAGEPGGAGEPQRAETSDVPVMATIGHVPAR